MFFFGLFVIENVTWWSKMLYFLLKLIWFCFIFLQAMKYFDLFSSMIADSLLVSGFPPSGKIRERFIVRKVEFVPFFRTYRKNQRVIFGYKWLFRSPGKSGKICLEKSGNFPAVFLQYGMEPCCMVILDQFLGTRQKIWSFFY